MERSIPGLLEHARQDHPDRTALTSGSERVSFAELHENAHVWAQRFTALGVRPGDRVGICLRPGLDQPTTLLAASCVGAIVIPMHPRLMATNIAHVARNAGMRLLLADPSRVDELTKACPGTTVMAGVDGLAVPLVSTQDMMLPENPHELAMLIYSSGSTGRPKGIMVTHENIVRGAEIVAEYLGTTKDDRIAGLLTLNFDYGLNQLWQVLLTGASLHVHDFVMPRTAFALLARERITALPVMPALIQRLFAPRFGGPPPGLDFSSIRYVCSSGGAISDWAIDRIRAAFGDGKFVQMYGLTEAFRSTYLPADELAARPRSVGKAIPGVALHVVDNNGEDCPPGVVGTLVHRGGCVSRGYWNNPESTAHTFRTYERVPGETVVWSGDLATKDEDGFVYILGRADSQLKRDGFRISPNEVERVLNEHPAIAESVVVGLPDGDRGHRIAVVWVARPGFSDGDVPDNGWLVQRLPAHMIPGEFRRIESFPTTANNRGKVDRLRLTLLFTEPEPVGASS